MTTSSLYHTQGIRGFKYQKTERSGNTEVYYLHSTASHLPCCHCGCRNTSIVKTGKTRDIRGLFIGLKKRLCECLYGELSVINATDPCKSLSAFALVPM